MEIRKNFKFQSNDRSNFVKMKKKMSDKFTIFFLLDFS